MKTMVSIRNLSKRYGNFLAVDNLNLEVKAGEIFSFLGVNGAGKTTTLKMLSGVLEPTTGSISIAGFDLKEESREAKKVTGYIPDRAYLYPGLTGREYLYFTAELYGLRGTTVDKRIDELLEKYMLLNRQDELISNYSHGMKQRIATCAALVTEPQLLIVDEPMVGLDPHGAKLLKDAFREYRDKGMTIFLSTHSLNVAEELSDRLAIIHRGKIVSLGTMEELREQSGLRENDLEDVFLQITLDNQASV